MTARKMVSPVLQPQPQARVWTDPLKDRINKPSCGCRQHFDPLQLRVTTRCQSEITPLLDLCRLVIQRLLGLHRFNKALQLLPMPEPLAQFVCQLKFRDFLISPAHVQTENIIKGVYPATLEVAKLQVILQVRQCPASQTANNEMLGSSDDTGNPAFVTSFQEGRTKCHVYLPTVTLKSILDTCNRTGTTIDTMFVKTTMQAMARYVMDIDEIIETCLTPECVAVTANGVIYVDPDHHWNPLLTNQAKMCDLEKYRAPEVLTKHFPISWEKALIWSIEASTVVMPMPSAMPAGSRAATKAYPSHNARSITEEMMYGHSETPKTPLLIKQSQPLTMTRRRRGTNRTSGTNRHVSHTFSNSLDSCCIRNFLTDLAKQCLNKDPFMRPKAKQVIRCLSQQTSFTESIKCGGK